MTISDQGCPVAKRSLQSTTFPRMRIKPLSSNRFFISEDHTDVSQAQRANRIIAESTLNDFSDSELQEVLVWSRPQGPDSRYDTSLTRDVEQMYQAQIRRSIKTCPEKKNKKAKVPKKKDSQGFLYLSKLLTANSHPLVTLQQKKRPIRRCLI